MLTANAQRQRAYKARMAAAGYKQKVYWVSEKESDLKMGKSAFLKKLESLTSNCSKEQLTKLYADIIAMVRGSM